MPMTHPSDETLEEYVMGRLSEFQIAAVEEHLLFCGDCQTSCTQIGDYIQEIRAALKAAAGV